MSSRVMDIGAAARETQANRLAAESGTGVRFCYHSDRTLEFTMYEGVRGIETTCDYCPAVSFAPEGLTNDLPPWAYLADGYPINRVQQLTPR